MFVEVFFLLSETSFANIKVNKYRVSSRVVDLKNKIQSNYDKI